jgi:PAS domain S-box-containing protein
MKDRMKEVLEGRSFQVNSMPYAVPRTRRAGRFDVRHSPLYGPSGGIIGILSVVQDVTEREEAKTRLRRQGEILEMTSDFAGYADMQGRPLFLNHAGRRMIGLDGFSDLTRMSLFDFLPPDARALHKNVIIPKVVRDGSWSGEMSLMHRDGNEIPVSSVILAQRTPDGAVGALAVIMRDISAHKQAQKKTIEHQRQLRALTSELLLAEDRERRRIASDLHDRLGPTLASARLKLEKLKTTTGDFDRLKRISEVQELLDRTSRDTRSLSFELRPPVLHEAGLKPAFEWLAGQLRELSGVSIRVTGDGPSATLSEDMRVLLFQSVRELLMNVAKHANARHATVAIRQYAASVAVAVDDDGVGMDDQGLNRLPEPPDGFGLFSIRERLRHIGGELSLRSSPGQGSRITLKIPLDQKRENAEGAARSTGFV